MDLAKGLGDRETEATVLWSLLLSNRFGAGDPMVGVQFGLDSIVLSEQLGLRRQAALARQDVARSYQAMGRLRESIQLLDQSIPYWREIGELPSLADGLRIRAGAFALLGEYDAGLADVAEAWQIDDSIRNIWGRTFSRLQRGMIRVERGELDTGLDDLRDAVAVGDTSDVDLLRLAPRAGLAFALLEAGRPNEVLGLMGDVVDVAPRIGISSEIGLALQTRVELALGHPEKAVELAAALGEAAALETLFTFGAIPFWAGPVMAYLALGETGRARRWLEPILEAITSAEARAWEPDARRLLAQILRAEGDDAGAERELRGALAVADEIGQVRNREQIVAMLSDLTRKGAASAR
jgi:tetratricopeptide (TPR) repeat protein